MAKRSKKRAAARAKKRASSRSGQTSPGGASKYAMKKKGEIAPQYRLEGGYLLDPEYMRHFRMPGPFVITLETSMERAA